MAKMTIYLPDELKARIDANRGENWSPLACRAFEARLSEIERPKGDPNMRSVIERLRKSKAEGEQMSQHLAHLDGVAWATSIASFDELGRNEELVGQLDDWIVGPFNMSYGVDECYVFQIMPDHDGSRHAAAAFWKRASPSTSPDAHDEDFVRAFALGADEVWQQVKDQV